MTRELTPYEQWLLNIVRDINNRTGEPAKSIAIAVQAGNVPQRTVQWWLRRLETAHAVTRRSPKTGYFVAEMLMW